VCVCVCARFYVVVVTTCLEKDLNRQGIHQLSVSLTHTHTHTERERERLCFVVKAMVSHKCVCHCS